MGNEDGRDKRYAGLRVVKTFMSEEMSNRLTAYAHEHGMSVAALLRLLVVREMKGETPPVQEA
jgi:hypothetical protein